MRNKRPAQISTKEAIDLLHQAGYSLDRTNGEHHIYVNKQGKHFALPKQRVLSNRLSREVWYLIYPPNREYNHVL